MNRAKILPWRRRRDTPRRRPTRKGRRSGCDSLCHLCQHDASGRAIFGAVPSVFENFKLKGVSLLVSPPMGPRTRCCSRPLHDILSPRLILSTRIDIWDAGLVLTLRTPLLCWYPSRGPYGSWTHRPPWQHIELLVVYVSVRAPREE